MPQQEMTHIEGSHYTKYGILLYQIAKWPAKENKQLNF